MQLLKKHPAISEETFLELIDAKKDSFYPWFYRILSNTALTFIKRHRRFASLEDWDESVTPMEQNAEILAMCEELARLEQKYREVLILKFNQDLTFREIAELTGKNENTVKTIYYHALELFRERMNPHETTE